MGNNIRVSLKRQDNGKPLMNYSFDGSLSDHEGILESAYDRINSNPDSFNNMRVLVEATDGKESMVSVVENYSWYKPKEPKNNRFATVTVNGAETKIKIPQEILNGPNFLNEALNYAVNHVKQAFQNNFPSGTNIYVGVKANMGNGQIMGKDALVVVGEHNMEEEPVGIRKHKEFGEPNDDFDMLP